MVLPNSTSSSGALDLPPLDLTNPRDRRVSIIWSSYEIGVFGNWEFLSCDLTRMFGVPVDIVVIDNNDWASHAVTEGRVILASFHGSIHEKLLHTGEANITSPFGVMIVNDEEGKDFDQSSLKDPPLIIRPYYHAEKYLDRERVLYVPVGYMQGRGPGDPRQLLPASQRKFNCWFLGTGWWMREDMVRAFQQAAPGLCDARISEGFTRGLEPAEYKKKLQETKIVLCPRGYSAETIRHYESWEFGAIPMMVEHDFNLARLDITHPGIKIILARSWYEAPKILQQWLHPNNTRKLDELQAYNIQWYQDFKQQIRLNFTRAVRSRL